MGHDPATWFALDWTPVLVAIIATAGTFLNTALILWFYQRSRVPSVGHPGKAMEEAIQTGHANNALLTMLARERGITVPPEED